MKNKEKVLIFRTAKMQVVELLMKQMDRESDITFLVQPAVVDVIREKYPFAKVISIRDTYFNHTLFWENVALNQKFDSVYILASGLSFGGYEEVFLIIEKIKYRNLILFNGKGERQIERRNYARSVMDNFYSVFAQAYMKIIAMWYRNFGKKCRF